MNGIVVCSGRCRNWVSFDYAEADGWHTVFFPAKRCVRYFCRHCWHLQEFIGDVKSTPAYELLRIFFKNSMEFRAKIKLEKVLIDGTEIKRWGQPIWLLDYHIVTISDAIKKVVRVDNGWQIEDWTRHIYTLDIPKI